MKIKDLSPYLFIVLFALVMVFPIFKDGFLVNLDNPIHLATSYIFIDNLKETKWVSGWSMDAFVGYPLQLFPRYQLGIWLIAFLNLVFSIPVFFAYKVVLFLSYVFPALVIFFIAKKFFNDTFSALVPSLIFLLVRRDVVVTALSGQWNSLLGLGLLLVFMYLTHKFFLKPTLKFSIKLALVFALILLSYVFAGLAAIMFFSVYFIVFSLKKSFSLRRFFFGITLFVIGAMLCGFYLLPMLDMPNFLSTYPGSPLSYNPLSLTYKVLGPFLFSVPKDVVTQQLFDAFSNDFTIFLKLAWLYFVSSIPQLLMFFLGIIGIFYFFEVWRRNDSTATFLTSIFIFMLICLVIGSGFWFLIPNFNIPVFGNVLAYRFLLYVNVSLFFFASFALSNMKDNFYPNKLHFLNPLFERKKMIFFILLLFFVANFTVYLPSKAETLTISQSSVGTDFFSTAEWVKNNVDKKTSRVVYQDFYRNYEDHSIGSTHLPSMFFYYTNVYSVGSWYDKSSYPTDSLSFTAAGQLFGNDFEAIDDNFIAARMRLVNAKYIVSVNSNLKNKLFASELFSEEFSSGNFTVFSLKDYTPKWVSYQGTINYNISLSNSSINLDYESDSQKNVLIKSSYHPYWRAYVDGSETDVFRSNDSLTILKLPEGAHSVLLSYTPFSMAYFMLTLITLIGCLFVLIFFRD